MRTNLAIADVLETKRIIDAGKPYVVVNPYTVIDNYELFEEISHVAHVRLNRFVKRGAFYLANPRALIPAEKI